MQYSAKVLKRHKVLNMVINGVLKVKHAAQELNLACRQTLRILKRFITSDMSLDSLTYQRKHPAWNKKDNSLKEKTFGILKKYPEVNCCHLTDILHEQTATKLHNTTIRNWLIEANLYQPRPQKRRPRKRFEMVSFGELVQMDTSEHLWLPLLGKEICMIALEDDHSRELLDVELVEHDTTWNNMRLIRQVIEQYGLFKTLYVDNDSMFKLISSG